MYQLPAMQKNLSKVIQQLHAAGKFSELSKEKPVLYPFGPFEVLLIVL